jgi:ubiquinone/menaquinone biosynthesis C-methylase UbiE
MENNKEKDIKNFFNKRIQIQGDSNFSPEIGDKNDSGFMILDFLKKRINQKKKILDAGCGEGRFSRYFIENKANITSMDFSEEYIRLAKKNLKKGRFVIGSVTNLPFKDNSFDFIFSVDVLQHVPDLEKAIKEFFRVLRKGGALIIVDKNKFGLHKKYLIPGRLIQKYKELTGWRYSSFKERWFNPKEFKEKLSRIFKEVEYEYLIENNKNQIFKIFPKLNLFVAWTAKK